MQRRLGLLLVVIPAIASAALVLADSLEQARRSPAPKAIETPKAIEAPRAKPVEHDDAQSQAPQHSTGEVIGVPMFA